MSEVSRKRKETTIRDVAHLAGVSQATVGRVIGKYGSVSEKTVESVLEAAKKLNYYPNAIAQSMKRKNTHTIGLVVANICNPFFSSIVKAVEDTAAKCGYNVIICNTDESISSELLYLKTLYEKRIDGIIIATAYKSDQILSKSHESLYNGTVPTVFIDRQIKGLDGIVVKTENYGGAYEAVSHLINLGHKDIGVISGPVISTMTQRIAGYSAAISNNNITYEPGFVVATNTASVEEGTKATKDILLNFEKRPTALLVLNNLLTIGALLAINELGLIIPDDIAIVGWDDFELARILNPSLTVVTQSTYNIGTIATEKLINVLENNRIDDSNQNIEIILKTNLIIRESCGYKSKIKFI